MKLRKTILTVCSSLLLALLVYSCGREEDGECENAPDFIVKHCEALVKCDLANSLSSCCSKMAGPDHYGQAEECGSKAVEAFKKNINCQTNQYPDCGELLYSDNCGKQMEAWIDASLECKGY